MTTLLIINLLVLVIVAGGLFFFFTKKNEKEKSELETFRHEFQNFIRNGEESMRGEIRNLQNSVTQQMQSQSGLLQTANTSLNERMDNAASVIGAVQKELGKVSGLVQSVDELQSILKAPKLRGNIGEMFLGDLLGNMFPADRFALQHRFKDGEAVDAVIYIGEKLVPIDAKFPLENFQKIVAEDKDEISKQTRRQFINDVKKHIQAVSKYIREDEGTYDFALMYIPAENVYYEIAAKDDLGGAEILTYAMKEKIILVSPNTFYAYLMTIMFGLRGMAIERHAETIMEQMGRVGKELGAFQKVYQRLGTHLENARKSYEDGDKRIDKVETKLNTFKPVEEISEGNESLEIEPPMIQ